MSWGTGLVGATITVLVSTLDDSVWLISFVGTESVPIQARIIHAITFTCTLVGLSILCCLLALGIKAGFFITIAQDPEILEIKLEALAVLICWLLAFGFCIRKLCRKRYRMLHGETTARTRTTTTTTTTNPRTHNNNRPNYGSLADSSDDDDDNKNKNAMGNPHDDDDEEDGGGSDSSSDDDDNWRQIPTSAQPYSVITLTMLGFLDEISYFPAVILGNIFDVYQLCLGTLFAAIIMLCIQAFLANQCRPLVKCLDDHVPLYGIIGIFAIVLTIHLILDTVKV